MTLTIIGINAPAPLGEWVLGAAALFGILVGGGLSLLILEHFSAPLYRMNVLRAVQLQWPVSRRRDKATTQQEGVPDALSGVVARDAADLKATIHPVGPVFQHDNVWLGGVDDVTKPSIVFRFRYVNASVYTLVLEEASGRLQMAGLELASTLVFERREIQHNYEFVIVLQFMLTTEASQKYARDLIAKNMEIYFSLDNVKVVVSAKEDIDVAPIELRFPQQYWLPPPPGT